METFSLILSISLPLLLVMDPLGNTPILLSLLKEYDRKEQQRIILRELLIALAILVLFLFVGDTILKFLEIDRHTIKIAGGLILFIISMKMVFPQIEQNNSTIATKDPFIVPIAIPLVAGPAAIASIGLYSHQVANQGVMLGAISLSWLITTIILFFAPHLKRVLRKRGLIACERLMGLLLILISVQMLLDGISSYVRQI